MFTSKRQIKKYVGRVLGDISEFLLPAALYTGKIDADTATEILEKVCSLGSTAIGRLSISYDKTPKNFDSARAYHAARRAYYKAAYGKAIADFEKGIGEALKPLKEKK